MTRYGLIADSGDKKRSPQCVYKLTLNDTENRGLCPLKLADCASVAHQQAAPKAALCFQHIKNLLPDILSP